MANLNIKIQLFQFLSKMFRVKESIERGRGICTEYNISALRAKMKISPCWSDCSFEKYKILVTFYDRLKDEVNMYYCIFISLLLNISFANAQDFETEARALVADLKSSLMKNLSEKIAKDGPADAIPFCHENVKPIAKGAAKDRITKFEFGRTSHKLRNESNRPQPWAESYLKEFQGTSKGDIKKTFIIHQLDNSKKVYLEPLYVETKCLLCHGENVEKIVKGKLDEIYPQDKATGFKLGEFRGFIWVKEK